MALIKCSDCGEEISPNAKTCPKCGNKKIQLALFKQWRKDNPTKFKLIFIFGIGIFILFGVIGNAILPNDCECNKLMNQYGILKRHNQFVPEESKSDHMYCVDHHFSPPTNEDGSNPCD